MIHTFRADSIQLNFGSRIILSGAYIYNETGKISALLGRNGSGKSCLFRIITGHLSTENRAVNIDDQPYFYSKNKSGLLTFLPQFNHVPKSLRIKELYENFEIPVEKLIYPFPEFKKLLDNKIGSLSGGERRLAELTAVIYHGSLFSILDEPFTALTPLIIDKVKEILLTEKLNKGFIISDHLYEHVIDISDDVYMLANGYTTRLNHINEIQNFGYARL